MPHLGPHASAALPTESKNAMSLGLSTRGAQLIQMVSPTMSLNGKAMSAISTTPQLLRLDPCSIQFLALETSRDLGVRRRLSAEAMHQGLRTEQICLQLFVLQTPVMDESVQMEEIAEEKPLSLESCLECFLQHEKLDLQDSWYCPKCKDHVQADKKLDLWSLPEVVLTIA